MSPFIKIAISLCVFGLRNGEIQRIKPIVSQLNKKLTSKSAFLYLFPRHQNHKRSCVLHKNGNTLLLQGINLTNQTKCISALSDAVESRKGYTIKQSVHGFLFAKKTTFYIAAESKKWTAVLDHTCSWVPYV